MKLSPVRTALALLFIFIGCFGTAYAAAGMLTALPAPAVGGTCGPSTGSETALEALAEPGSIGAGPEPPTSNATAHHQWQTFVQQCQTLADRRGLASLAVFVASVAVAVIGLLWVLRGSRKDGDADETSDGPSEWPVEPRSGDPAELVGAGAVIAPPSGAAVGTWGEPPAPGYGPAPYPAPQAWAQQPPAPHPYPYGPPPGYPQQAGYPPPYPAPPGYAPPGAYPVPPGYAPPAPPAPPAYPAGPTAPAGAPTSAPPPPAAAPVDAAPEPAAQPERSAPPEPSAGPGGAGSGPVHPHDD